MNCRQCQGIEEIFSQDFVTKELERNRRKGPSASTRLLTEAIKEAGVGGLTLLDIGGGLGNVQIELIEAGVSQVTSVDASTAYLSAAREEAQRRGCADQIEYRHGDFVDLAQGIRSADIVTLDRVICCYPHMEKLVSLSAERAGRLYGLVYPRDTWWVKTGLAIANFFFRIRKNHFRTFVHATRSVEEILSRNGFKKTSNHHTFVWQVAVYDR